MIRNRSGRLQGAEFLVSASSFMRFASDLAASMSEASQPLRRGVRQPMPGLPIDTAATRHKPSLGTTRRPE